MSFFAQGEQRFDELMKTEEGRTALYNSIEKASQHIQAIKGVLVEERRPLVDQPTFWGMVTDYVKREPDTHLFYAISRLLNEHTSFERIREHRRHE